jgi:hypothetical protein
MAASGMCIAASMGVCGAAVAMFFVAKSSYDLATEGPLHLRTWTRIGKTALLSASMLAFAGTVEAGVALYAKQGVHLARPIVYGMKSFMEIGPAACSLHYPECP